MQSIRHIYKIGIGPSSSHSMAPRKAAQHFLQTLTQTPTKIRVELYGSLAATGKGHLTDVALENAINICPFVIVWKPEVVRSYHPCGMLFQAMDDTGNVLREQCYYSVGGGELEIEEGRLGDEAEVVYEHRMMVEVMRWCRERERALWEYVLEREGETIWAFLEDIWRTMTQAVERGTQSGDAVLPGILQLQRRSQTMLRMANKRIGMLRDMNLLAAYALAVAEENAAGQTIVTAPTCGSCGVMPAILYYLENNYGLPEAAIHQALATSGLFGASIAECASISGAEIGCQGEIGSACAMAAAAATQLLGGTIDQIEYAAEMALEHMLGLTCDPVAGLVQIPCIERNAFAAMRAMECASYALATDGHHHISFDQVVEVMNKTGLDLQMKYKETALGGLAEIVRQQYNWGNEQELTRE